MKLKIMKGIYILITLIVITSLTGCATSPNLLQTVTIENNSSYTIFIQGVEIKQGCKCDLKTEDRCFVVTAKIAHLDNRSAVIIKSVKRVKAINNLNHVIVKNDDFRS